MFSGGVASSIGVLDTRDCVDWPPAGRNQQVDQYQNHATFFAVVPWFTAKEAQSRSTSSEHTWGLGLPRIRLNQLACNEDSRCSRDPEARHLLVLCLLHGAHRRWRYVLLRRPRPRRRCRRLRLQPLPLRLSPGRTARSHEPSETHGKHSKHDRRAPQGHKKAQRKAQW